MAQTEEFIFQNVAYRPTVYRTGGGSIVYLLEPLAQSLISLLSDGDVQPLKNDIGNEVIVRDRLNFFLDFFPPAVPFLGFLVGVLLFELL